MGRTKSALMDDFGILSSPGIELVASQTESQVKRRLCSGELSLALKVHTTVTLSGSVISY